MKNSAHKAYAWYFNFFRLYEVYVGPWEGDVLTGQKLYRTKF